MNKHRSTRRLLIAAPLVLILSLLLSNTTSAWNTVPPKDIHKPYLGLDPNGDDTHQWIVDRALEYLKKHGRIEPGSWFDSVEFANLVKWGAGYADNTGRQASVTCFGYEVPWDFDGNHHFYHPEKITILYEGGLEEPFVDLFMWFCGDMAHVGDLPAPIYSQQLYERAVEFWPHGDTPLALSSLQEPLYLGYVASGGSRVDVAGWGRGTDPRTVWEVPSANFEYKSSIGQTCSDLYRCEESARNNFHPPDEPEFPRIPRISECYHYQSCVPAAPPEWPPWVASTQSKPHHTAAIYLGWATHLVQDQAVVHHGYNLHGTHHQDFEALTHDLLLKSGRYQMTGSFFGSDMKEGDEICTLKPICDEFDAPASRTAGDIAASMGITVCTRWELYNQCHPALPIAPDFAFADPATYDAQSLAISSASIVDQQLKKVPGGAAPDDWNSLQKAIFTYDYQHYALDTAIKASAALIYKFISDVSAVSLPADRFESNDTVNMATAIYAGDHQQLTLHSLADIDYYAIELLEPGDLSVHIDYDPQMVDLAVELTGPLGIYWPGPQRSDGDLIELEQGMAGKYLLKIEAITTGTYDLRVSISDKKLNPDSYEENDSLSEAQEYHSGCDFTGLLTIDQAGDDDYYFVEVPAGWRVDGEIEFDPAQGQLALSLLDAPASGGVQTAQGSGVEKKLVSVSACGTSPRTHFRVSGQTNNYTLCLTAHADSACGFPETPGPAPLSSTISTSVALDNVNLVTFSGSGSAQGAIRGNVYTPPDGDQDGGGNVSVGDWTVVMSPRFGFMDPQVYVLLATTADEKKLVVSGSKTNLTGIDFDSVFPEIQPAGGQAGLLNTISGGVIAEDLINPCRSYWEILALLDLSCESMLESAGSVDGALLTPLKDQALLYTFPGGDAIGTVRGN